jgi:hypothetical protein
MRAAKVRGKVNVGSLWYSAAVSLWIIGELEPIQEAVAEH